MTGKHLELSELSGVIDKARSDGKKIALANGGFDILHIGHIRYLKASKEIADILVVAINSDRSLRELKGDHRAEIDENGRAKVIGALSFVDYVTVFDERRVDRVLMTIKPDFHCKGT
ncbi:MAG: adenylyltransferase/cytidyltransferase family protein, partial [Candidatus Aminicenantes bacterium]|nr:adenylyltransferase/cytidyltransferase family protein [Candidatus Aminicenantes bacterium]